MKTYIDFLMEGVEGYSFREVVDNIDADQFEDAAEAYHEYRMEQYKNEGLILLPKSLTAENGAKSLLMGEFIENIQVRTNWTVKHATSWNIIKDIYKKIVEHYGK